MFKLLETNYTGDRRYLIGNYAVWFYPHRRMNIGQMKPIPIIRGFLYKSYIPVNVSYFADFYFFKISWSKNAPLDLTTYEGKDFLKQNRPDVDLRGNFVFSEEAKELTKKMFKDTQIIPKAFYET